MRKRKFGISPLGLDSLVDIVSNSVGILVILTVFMALVSLLDPDDPIPQKEKVDLLVNQKIEVPWTHYSQKSSLLFLIRDNHLLYFDRALIYQKLKDSLQFTDEPDKKFSFAEFDVELLIYTHFWHCLDFQPRPQAGEWWHRAETLDELISQYSPSEFYFFFWVDANDFEMFREVRDYLREHNFETGWKPVLKRSDLRYCSGASRYLSFQPQ